MPSPRTVLACLLVSPLYAQEPDSASLREKLASDDAATVAWAAYDAGRLGRRELVPELRSRLQRLERVEGDARATAEHRAVVAAVFDALIRTGAILPPKELAPWLERRATEAMVLAARTPGENAGLLLGVVERSRSPSHWTAACNLLLTASPGMLAPKLLELVQVRLEIEVTSPDQFFLSSSVAMGRGCGTGHRLEGFPPVVSYHLHLARSPDLVADGPEPVSFVRTERAEASFGVGGSTPDVDRADYALRCLYWLVDRSDRERTLHSRIQECITWSGADALRVAVAAIEQELMGEWSRLLGELAERSFVSPEVAKQRRLRIVRAVHDRRAEADRKEPLPELGDGRR